GKELHALVGHDMPVTAVAFLADSKSIVGASEDKMIKVWDTASGKLLKTIKEPGNGEVPVIAAQGNSRFAIWVTSNTVEIYDADAAKKTETLTVEKAGQTINSLSISADGTRAAVGSKEGKINLWNLSTKKIETEFDAGKMAINDLCLTADNQRLIAADNEGGLLIWEVSNPGKPVHTIKAAHTRGVQAFAVSKDGKRFATASLDGVVKLWDVLTGKELRAWDYRVPFQQGRTFLASLVFTPDGKRLISANADATVWVLDAEVK
ncbi:MAG: hypothetical protein EBV06_13505, partial [Planctomycetia bacterium]|nr:hypothetical protein [Planctomycetia bacterium]